jgi:hypothetical protein
MTEQAIKAIGAKPDRSEVLAVTAKILAYRKANHGKGKHRGGGPELGDEPGGAGLPREVREPEVRAAQDAGRNRRTWQQGYGRRRRLTRRHEKPAPINGIKGNLSGGTAEGRGNKAAKDDGGARERRGGGGVRGENAGGRIGRLGSSEEVHSSARRTQLAARGPSGNRPRERSNTSGWREEALLDIEGGDLAGLAAAAYPLLASCRPEMSLTFRVAATKSASRSLRAYTSI